MIRLGVKWPAKIRFCYEFRPERRSPPGRCEGDFGGAVHGRGIIAMVVLDGLHLKLALSLAALLTGVCLGKLLRLAFPALA